MALTQRGKEIMPSGNCIDLAEQFTTQSLAYIDAVNADDAGAAEAFMSAMVETHNNLVAAGCVKGGIYQVQRA